MYFQKVMNDHLGSLPFVKVFMDDILIHSTTIQNHFNHLDKVLSIIRDLGLTINPSKCRFFQKSVTYLGMLISSSGISPAPRNLDLLRLLPMPKNRRGVRRILGSLNFFRSLVPNFSSKVASLSSKLKDSVPFIWHKKDTEIVQSIISELQTAKLAFPDYSNSNRDQEKSN